MKKLLLGMTVLALATAAVKAQFNPCVAYSVTNCYPPPSVALAPVSPITVSVCATVSASTTLITNTGRLRVTTVDESCSQTSTTIATNYPTVVSNWTVVYWNSQWTTNAGLSASFAPTNTGSGTITFYAKYTTPDPCPGLYTTNRIVSVTVTNCAPLILTQPADQTVIAGDSATFNVSACGAGLGYQWRFNGVSLPGATASSFTTNNVQAGSAGTYTVVITNSVGSATSTNAVLTVLVPPTIITQPISQTLAQGSNATFNVVADGSAPLSYQWRFNGANLPGATASSFTTNNVQAGSAGTYTVVITNSAGSVTSTNAVLTVLVPPTITTQPASQTVAQGSNATFNVVADGSAPLSYQWRFNGASLPGATASSFTTNNVQAGSAGTYTVVITNSAGSVTSTNAVLTVLVPPTITTQPASQTVAQGATVTFNVVADGSAPLSYQWRFNGSSLPGATGSLLALNNVQVSDIGNYSAVVTNLAGSLTSSVAALNLTCAAPPSGLVAWWPAEGNASDIIGGHDGALRGNATANATGQVGQAFSFDGTNDFVQIPDSFAFHPTNFTIEAWVRFAAMDSAGLGGSPAQDQYIVFKQNTRTNSFEGFDLSKTSDKFRFLVSSKLGSSVVVNSTNHISTNVWYHVAGVRGSNYLQLYINGQLHSQATVNFAQDYGPWSLFFGSSGRSYWDHKLKGNLDDVGFFNRALAAPEIQAIYSAAAAGKCSPPPSVTLLAPADGARFWAPDRITLAATAYSADRGVTNVEFFADGTRIGQSATPTNSVYTCAWTNPAVGAFALIAVAHDGSLAVTSSVAHVLVDSSASFVKGINLNGPSVVIEGNSWLSYTQALANGLSVSTNAMPGVNTNISPLVPSTTTDVDTMLQTFLRRFRFPPSQQQATNPPHFRPTRDDSFASSSYFTVTLSNVPPGLMVSNAITYRGWCSDHEHGIQPDEPCILYSVGDPFLDSDPRYRGKNLNKLNYLINHKSCTNYMEVQNAIWSLLGQGLDQNYLTPNFTAMTNDAHLHGGNFIPAPDDIALVLCNDSTNDQPVVIEIGGQGCTNNPVSFTLSQSGLTNGYYYVALYLVENLTNYARSLDFLVQDAKVATQVGTELQSCNWAKYGAFGANVTNGILKVEVSSPAKGDPMLMGLAIYSADANQPPTIITQPTNQNVGLGSNATFTVTATGTPPLHYQWRFNGTNLAAATLASLTLPSIESTQAGTYTVLVTNAFGSVLSSNAVLTISSLAPTVQITLPTNGQCFRPPTNILLQARALSPNSPVSEVRFFKESGLLGISLLGSNDIYSLTWTNARPGSYLLTASVSNQIGLSATSAPISVCILSNIPPLVNAGPDQPIVLPQSAALLLAGAASDPDGPADLAISWSKITGQGTVRFESAGPGNPAAINAWFSSAGDYLLRLFASDSEDSSSDDVLVTVTATNAAPAVSAGPDQTLTFPDYVYLPGQATDDGLPVGSTLTTTWSNCTPSVGTVTFDDPYSANTMARFASPGTYLLGLTASDGEKTSSTNVTVNIAAFSGTEYLQNVDVISAGVAGLRETNQGVIHLQGLSGKVKKAYLYWHGPTDSADPNVNQSVWLNRRLVTGRNIGFSFDNNWDFASGEQYANSQAYRADVTLLVAAFGSGDYLLRDLTKAAEVTANGASLIVFFDNPASTNKQDIILQQGNDSNGGFSFGVGGNNVSAIALGPDGGFIIGGYFASVGPVYESRNCIGKLHQNATLDYSFDPGTGVNPGMPGQVKAVALQPDGAVIIAGEFVSVDGASLTNIARFSSDGGLDAAFNMGAGADSSVNTLVLQPDGKIVLGGNFAHCNDIARSRIARLNADGSLDTGFNPGAGADGSINALALDGSGKILIGGDFTHYNGANRSRIARLNANGTLDSSFDPGAGADGSIEALALDPQGKILIGGDFGNYNGDSRPHMARLNPDGTLDAAFDPADAPNAPVLALSIQDGTNILAGGSFTMLGTNAFGRLARIKADGAIDTSFASAPGADGAVLVIVQENTGNLLIGGQFSNFDGAEHGLIARLDRDGHPLRTPLDPGWRLEFANIHYTNGPASIELHVGDGQYWSPDGSDYGASFWDQDMFINGSTWWQPEPMPTCYLTDDSQIFAGYSVPSAAGACGSRLWDIREKNLTGFLTNSPAPQALTIETAPPGLKGDYLALIVAMAKLPAGSVTNICHGQSVPTNLPPIARPDSFAVQRGAGGQLLDVLNNDSSPSQTLLAISAVGSASHGATAVIYDRSAVLYTPNQGYSGADSFSYTVTDAYGNSATATVALDVAGTDHAVLLCGQPQSGMLGVSGGVTTVRGSSQPADFYRFEAASGATVSIGLTTVDFKSHIYLRDPFGKLVASGSHSIYSYRNGNGQLVETDSLGSSIDNYPVLSSGIYTIEVTAHSRHAAGIYTLEFHTDTACQPQSRLQVWADGVNVPNGGVVDFGTSLTRTITILNAGTADAGEAAVWAYDPFAATPGTLPAPFAPGVARTVILTLDTNTPPGPTNQWIQIQNLSVNLTAFVPLPGPRPTATLTSPAGGTISYVPTNVVLSATASATTNTASIAKVEFFATTPFGRMSLGAATTPPYTCTWQNPPAGSYALSAWATDSDGRVGSSASVPITLTHRPPNQPPVAVNDTNNVFINVPNILPVLENDSDPNGDPLTIISVSAQNGTATISGDSRTIRYTPLANSYGDDILQYTISDGRNATATAKVYVSIIQTTVAVISPADNTLISTNVPITITASASTSDGAIARVEFYANNQKIAEHWSTPYQTTWSATNTGVYFLKAVALDTKGFITASEPVRLRVGDPTDMPVAQISNLKDGQIIRPGAFDLFGTASNLNANVPTTYHLRLYRPDDGQGQRLVADLTPAGRSGPKLDQLLERLDFSTVQNGAYLLELEVASEINSVSQQVRFILENNLKIGQFTFTEQDLTLPVSGIPLAVTRTYNSINPALGDFGFGWTYAMNDLDVEIDEERALVDELDSPENEQFNIRVGGGRDVTLTLPDGRRTTFYFYYEPGACNQGDEASFCYYAKWKAPYGVNAKLTSLDHDALVCFWGGLQWWSLNFEAGVENFDFRGFQLETADGTRYTIQREDLGLHSYEIESLPRAVNSYGKCKLTTIRTRAGDRITITSTNIQHFDSAERLTRSLILERTNNNLIAAIRDPRTLTGRPALKYQYDALTNLSAVYRLVNASAASDDQAYAKTTYNYTNTAFPHYLTSIQDARGVTVARSLYDETGKLIQAIDAAGNVTRFDHDLDGRKETVTDPLGQTTIHQYDERGNVTATVNALGQTTSRVYSGNNDLLSETDPLGHTIAYTYDDRGLRLTTTDPLGHTVSCTYDDHAQVTTITDARGHTTTNLYDPNTGNLTATIQALNSRLIVTSNQYDSVTSQLTATIDPLGNRTELTNDATGNLLKTTSKNVGNNVLSETIYAEEGGLSGGYDDNGNRLVERVTRTTPGGSQTALTRYEYDGQNRLLKTILPLHASGSDYTTQTAYDVAGKPDTTADMYGRVTRYFYDVRGNLTQTLYPDGSISRTWYDALGHAAVTTDRTNAASPTDTITVNGSRTLCDPVGRTVRAERLKDITLDLVASPGASATNYDCQLLEPAPMVLSSASTEYDAAGRVASTTDERGSVTYYGYDAAGRRTTVQDALGNVSAYGYDQSGNQLTFTDALGRTTTNVFDDLGRLIAVHHPLVTNETAAVTTIVYDDAGRRIAETDLGGVVTGFRYDGLGRLLSVTNAYGTADQTVTSYAYDEAGNQISQTDAEGRVTTFEYDKLGRRIKRTLPGTPPGGQSEETLYEVVFKDGSNPPRVLHKKVTDFKTNVVYYVHDELDRLEKKIYGTNPAAAPAVTYGYGPGGQRSTMVDATGTTEYWYDDFNRLSGKTIQSVFSANAWHWSYGRDAKGNLLSMDMQSPVSYRQDYTWDPLGRLQSPSQWVYSYGWYLIPIATCTYDAVGNLQGLAIGLATGYYPFLDSIYHYDERNRLTDMASRRITQPEGGVFVTNILGSFHYNPADRRLGPTGARRAARETINAAVTISRAIDYYYDSLYRLTKEDITQGTITGTIAYTNTTGHQGYDQVGNRRSRAVSTTDLVNAGVSDFDSHVFDDRDRLSSGYTYDGNGNTRTGPVGPPVAGNVACGYDPENRLIWQTNADGTVIHVLYDGDGNRVGKTVARGGVTTTNLYLLDDQNPSGYVQVVAELTNWYGGLAISRSYLYGHNLISETLVDPSYTVPPATSYYGYDGHGNVRYLTDNNGQITDTYTYDAFGILIARTGTTPNNYLYCGEQFDPDLGTYYLRARYYSPQIGRFWTMDTYEGDNEDPLSLHKYLYCSGNPVNAVDPTGNMEMVEVLAVSGIQGIVASLVVASVATAALEMPFRSWTIWEGVETTPFHVYVVAVGRDTTYRYDISVSARVAVLAPLNPLKHYKAKLVVSSMPKAQALIGFRAPVGRLSETTFEMWNRFVIGTPFPMNGWTRGCDYVYAYLNCVTYSTFLLSPSALGLSLLPF